MALETGVTYIDDLVDTNPTATDDPSEGDDHIRNIKTAVQGSFPSLGSAAVTATAAELNIMDGVTSTTAELNLLDGVTKTTAELNATDSIKLHSTVAPSGSGNAEFTGINSTAKQLIITFKGLTLSSVNDIELEIGSGSYSGSPTASIQSRDWDTATKSTGPRVLMNNIPSGEAVHGQVIMTLQDAATDLWFIEGKAHTTASSYYMYEYCGYIDLGGDMDRLKIELGSGTFTGGTVGLLERY